MCEYIINTIFGVLGTIFGIIISFICQLIINKIQNKKENRRVMYQLKINTYADAVRYISLCCRQNDYKNNIEAYNKIVYESEELYNKFHPIFSIIAPKSVIEEYNTLRNEADSGSIKASDAYIKVTEILNFNISKDIS